MDNAKKLSPSELRDRAIRFYTRYGQELEQVAELLEIKLRQLALAYTIGSKLPREAVKVTTRVKSLDSFLEKLENKDWPQFYYVSEVVKDIIGARVVCWFRDDVSGMLQFIKESNHFDVLDTNKHPIKDYISKPQIAGYRAIHLFTNIEYDGVAIGGNELVVETKKIICEIQVRSRMQDAWADITHDFFYKAKNKGVNNDHLESFLSDISERLSVEDGTLMRLRDRYQELADDKSKEGVREGFKEG